MASVRELGNGKWIIRFFVAGGQRRTIRLANFGAVRSTLRQNISRLEEASRRGAMPGPELQDWLQRLSPATRARFVESGLIVGAAAAAIAAETGPIAKPAKRGAAGQALTLARFLQDYIASRADVKPSTRRHLLEARDALVEFFGQEKRIREVSPADADAFRAWLKAPNPAGRSRKRLTVSPVRRPGRALGENTARRWCGRAKQFFRAAVRGRLIAENPFADVRTAVQANRSRDFEITAELAARVLIACRVHGGERATQWAAAFGLAYYAALRVPSELFPLTWGDVRWGSESTPASLRVRSPKTEHHPGHDERQVPMCPELRKILQEALKDAVESGRGTNAERIIAFCDSPEKQLHIPFGRILDKAGIEQWPKLFQNLRQTRETEWSNRYGLQNAAKWTGNSEAVAKKHYLQASDAAFSAAANEPRAPQSAPQSKSDAVLCGTVRNELPKPRENSQATARAGRYMPPVGAEQAAFSREKAVASPARSTKRSTEPSPLSKLAHLIASCPDLPEAIRRGWLVTIDELVGPPRDSLSAETPCFERTQP